MSETTNHRWVSDSITIEERADLEQYVRDLLGADKAGLWWRSANPMFGGLAPDYLMQMGRSEAVYKFIAAAREANGDGSQ